MSKHATMILLGILVAVFPVLGFPSWIRTAVVVISGLIIAVLAYLSSVVYCSNCKKLIQGAENAIPVVPPEPTKTVSSDSATPR
ncbi:MAG: hypothetical protein PHS95_02790 [Candidatus Pacebacteria bacterium]|nr:hypothetical protein [Candidatus Paceibacterota bacterium]